MGRHKKRKCFIPKSEGNTFCLLRPQEDQLIGDESLANSVHHPTKDALFSETVSEAEKAAGSSVVPDGEQLEERQKFGIFYRDDYNYLQHLKGVGEAVDISKVERTVVRLPPSVVRLPTTVFETEGVERVRVGLLLNQAPDQPASDLPDVDLDIAAALEGYLEEGDFDEDDGLDDDFILKATGGDGTEEDAGGSNNPEWDKRFGTIRNQRMESGSESSCDSEEEEEVREKVVEGKRRRLACPTTQGGATKMIDEQFDAVYAREYGSDDDCGSVGDGQYEDAEGMEPSADQLRDMFGAKGSLLKRQKIHLGKPEAALKQRTLEAAARAESMEEQGSGEAVERLMVVDKTGGAERWDCESILSMSTYSTLYNHPTLIRETAAGTRRRKQRSEGLSKIEDEEAMDCDGSSTVGSDPASNATNAQRPKDESAEERRARKHAVKEQRRLRREEKKANQLAFKEESKKIALQRGNPSSKTRPIK